MNRLSRLSGWHFLLLLIALPVLITLFSLVAAFFNPDLETLSHLVRYVLPDTLLNTLLLVLGVCIASGLLGTSLAWLTAICDFPLRGFFSWALFLPMAIPGYVMAFAFVGLFEFAGPVQSLIRDSGFSSGWFPNVNSYAGVTLVLTLVLYPYIYLLAKNAFQTQGKRSLEVGQSLGLSPRQSFFKVAVPMARPWIVGGLLLVGMETLADFGTVAVFNYDTLTTAIYKSWFSLYSTSAALQLAAVLVLVVAVVVALEKRTRREQRYAQARNLAMRPHKIKLRGWNRLAAVALCGLTFVLAFVLPLYQLLAWSLPEFSVELTAELWSYAKGSLSLATIAVFIVVSLALSMAFIARLHEGMFSYIAVRLSTLGYALPGTVLAVALYVPITYIDHQLQALGVAANTLQGTLVVMMLAYSVRFMAVAYSPLEANFLRVTSSVDLASRSMGISGIKMLYRVHMPMLKTGLLTAIVLVFVDVMKELPITLMTRPFGFNTLAVRVFELTSEGLWERAALPAIVIVLAGLMPVILLISRADAHSRAS